MLDASLAGSALERAVRVDDGVGKILKSSLGASNLFPPKLPRYTMPVSTSLSSSSQFGSLVQIVFCCKPLRMEQLPLWLASKARTLCDGVRPELSVVHYKGFGQTMDIRARPPSADMLSMLCGAGVVVFDGDRFEVASDSDGICVNFVCALPMICSATHSRAESGPALLAFKLEDEETDFLRSWQGLRCCIGSDQLPYKITVDAHNLPSAHVIEITYVLIPRNVCSPSYRGGILWNGFAGSKLPSQRTRIFSSILEDAKKISGWENDAELNQSRVRCNLPPFPVRSYEAELPQSMADSLPVFAGWASAHVADDEGREVSSENSHEALFEARGPVGAVSYFSHAKEGELAAGSSYFVSLGTLATLATAAVDHSAVLLKRQVVAWGGYHVVTHELAAESALYSPNFADCLPWHYFHAERTKRVGAIVERQEGLLNGAKFRGLHCH